MTAGNPDPDFLVTNILIPVDFSTTPNPTAVSPKARAEHYDRLERIGSMGRESQAIAEGIDIQADNRNRVTR